MAKIGRNDPGPGGSGQKYKRCCLLRDDAAAAERAAAERATTEHAAARAREAAPSMTYAAIGAEDEGLDDASHGVIDLIEAGRLDEAEHAAQHLLARYPDVHDGLERLAMVAAARGDRLRAAAYYRQAADVVHAHADQYGPKMEVYLRARATECGEPLTEASGDQDL